MKFLIPLILFFPIFSFGQFGFQQDTTNTNIQVIKNGIQQKHPWVGGLDYCQYSNIDLDFDGVADLLIFDKTTNKILTFLQKGATGVTDFEYAPSYEKAFEEDIDAKFIGWFLLADYNLDGKPDIFTARPGGIRVYKNTSSVATGLSFEVASSFLSTTVNGNFEFIFSSQSSIPALDDIDNDGDLDILSFYLGSCVRYYKNMSNETYGNSDSLIFKTVNVCYGDFQESADDNTISLNSCCGPQVNDPEFVFNERPLLNLDDRHSGGSTLLSLDLDGDQMKDLIIGDALYRNLTMLMNGGTQPNTIISMVSQDNLYLGLQLPNMPGTFHVDVNNDNIRDLLVSPSAVLGAQNYKSNWYYKNDGADDFPDFQFQQNDFLQSEMIDFGSGALPVLFDHNGDGLQDLLVSIKAKYNLINGSTASRIAYYENTGTATNPEFTLITEDYMNLASLGGGGNWYFYPAFGDLDGDGDEDMVLGENVGNFKYFENTAGAGNPAAFANFTIITDNNASVINEGNLSVPKLVDLNRDGKLDLILGKRSGKLSYYENIGTSTNFEFELKTATLGNVDVSEYWINVGFAIPEFLDVDNEYHLIVGSKSGALHYYDQIEGNLASSFHLVDTALEDIYIGDFSAPAIADFDGDGRFEMILGNQRGGVALFKSAPIVELGLTTYDIELNIYPNPADQHFIIDLSESGVKAINKASFTLIDMTGKEVIQEQLISKNMTKVNTDKLGRGLYVLRIYLNNQLITKRIVLE